MKIEMQNASTCSLLISLRQMTVFKICIRQRASPRWLPKKGVLSSSVAHFTFSANSDDIAVINLTANLIEKQYLLSYNLWWRKEMVGNQIYFRIYNRQVVYNTLIVFSILVASNESQPVFTNDGFRRAIIKLCKAWSCFEITDRCPVDNINSLAGQPIRERTDIDI